VFAPQKGEEIVTLAEHLKEANRKLTEMQGKLQQKKQMINEYRVSVRKAVQEIVELNESQLKLNTLQVWQISEMTSWKRLFSSRIR
jgi:ABC-type Fe3+-citrate transport system substrate-binding protein